MEKSPKHETNQLPYALRDKRELSEGDTFCFGCHPDLPCFTDCCADINIFLTPVDVLRLSRRLNMSTTDFLDQHTLVPITKDLHLPVVVLKMGDDPKKRCSFVGEQGCKVYQDRPWSCRMYPLGMAIPPARAGVEPKPLFFLFEDDFCKGHSEQKEWTVKSWRDDQRVDQQEELESGYRDLVSHPFFIGGTRQLDPRRMEMFYTGCYDLDTFRRFVFESTFLQRFELEDEQIEKIRESDEELLRFSFRWLRFALFGEPTIRTKTNNPNTGSQE